jgi:molybdopterin synthase catalytic subunit
MKQRGEITCWISEEKINQPQILEMTPQRSHGAQNYFFGSVREVNLGKKVVAVSYDAYIPLGEKILREISMEAQDQWGFELRITVSHRVGALNVGECSVGIGVSSPHRDEAYQASRYIIEQIKKRAPIWKKEFYEDGETEWLKGHALCQHH